MDSERVWFFAEVFGGIFGALLGLVLLSRWLQRRQVEGAAARISRQMGEAFAGQHEYALVSADAFAWLDHRWYGEMQRRLEACGYTFAGDIEDTTLSRVHPRLRTFMRVMISRRGQVRAAIFEVRPRGFFLRALALVGLTPRRVRCVELVSEDSDGGSMVTTTASAQAILELPIEVERVALGPEATPEDLVRLHRQRIAERPIEHARILTFEGIDDVIASCQRGDAVIARHRAALATPVTEDEMHRIAGEQHRAAADLVVEELYERRLRRG